MDDVNPQSEIAALKKELEKQTRIAELGKEASQESKNKERELEEQRLVLENKNEELNVVIDQLSSQTLEASQSKKQAEDAKLRAEENERRAKEAEQAAKENEALAKQETAKITKQRNTHRLAMASLGVIACIILLGYASQGVIAWLVSRPNSVLEATILSTVQGNNKDMLLLIIGGLISVLGANRTGKSDND